MDVPKISKNIHRIHLNYKLLFNYNEYNFGFIKKIKAEVIIIIVLQTALKGKINLN